MFMIHFSGKTKKIYNFMTMIGKVPLCNRKPGCAPILFGKCFLLCWRCSGIIAGILLGEIIMHYYLIHMSNYEMKFLVLSTILIIPTAIDGTAQYFFKIQSTNFRRAFTGFLAGLGVSLIRLTL
jgi:uncharacterized membrane protein